MGEARFKRAGITDSENRAGDSLPAGAMGPVLLVAGTVTTLYGALDPSLASTSSAAKCALLKGKGDETVSNKTYFIAHSGAFLHHCSVMTEVRRHAVGKDKEEMLWSLSEKLAGQKFEY